MMVCLKKIFNGEIICHLKRRLKRLCYYKWKAWYKLLSSSGLKKKIAHIFIIHQSSFEKGHTILPLGTKYCVAILWKSSNWKFVFSWRKINWYVLQIAKAYFSYTIWLMISEKSIVAYTFLHHGMVGHAFTKCLRKQGIQKKLFTRISNSFIP